MSLPPFIFLNFHLVFIVIFKLQLGLFNYDQVRSEWTETEAGDRALSAVDNSLSDQASLGVARCLLGCKLLCMPSGCYPLESSVLIGLCWKHLEEAMMQPELRIYRQKDAAQTIAQTDKRSRAQSG